MSGFIYTWSEEQKEAMQEAASYLERLIPVAEELLAEFQGDVKEDSLDYLKLVIDGLNWVIELYNVTRDVINEQEEQIDTETMDKAMKRFGSAVAAHDEVVIAEELNQSVLPFLRKMKEIADTAC